MPKSEKIDLADLTLQRLTPSSPLKPFDCGDVDINGYFHDDALHHCRELLGVTYTFETDADTVAFFTVLNDKIINRDSRSKIVALNPPGYSGDRFV